MTLRLAVAQGVSVAGDVAANIDTATRLVRRAGADGARLVLLPEAFLTGYAASAFAGALPHEDDLAGDWLAPLCAAATATGTVVVVSTPLQRASGKTLSLLVIQPGGRVAAPYDKQHLFDDERAHFTHGDHGASLALEGWELGLSICYDACFPDHARAAADAGATAYLNCAAYFVGGDHRRDLYPAARALDNGMYVAFAGLAGPCGDAVFSGGSAIYDPEGRVLGRLGDEEGVVVTDLDPDLVLATRQAHRMHADHRAELGPRVVL